MALLTKWNLSEACGSDILKFSRKICRDDVILPTSVKQGHQLMDQMNVPHISFRKAPIMTYMEETHYLHYRPIFDAIKELLSNQEYLTIVPLNLHHYTMKDRGFIANNTMENGGKEYKSRFLQNPRFCQSSCILMRQPATIWVNLASIQFI